MFSYMEIGLILLTAMMIFENISAHKLLNHYRRYRTTQQNLDVMIKRNHDEFSNLTFSLLKDIINNEKIKEILKDEYQNNSYFDNYILKNIEQKALLGSFPSVKELHNYIHSISVEYGDVFDAFGRSNLEEEIIELNKQKNIS